MMAPFEDDESGWSRLDYRLLRDGGVVLYNSEAVLREDVAWLRAEKYQVQEFDARRWNSESDFHDEVARSLGFPDYYGQNLDAFNDCMGDILVPAEGGMAIVIRNADTVGLRDRELLPIVLDILADVTRKNMLFGRRFLTLVQSEDPRIEFAPIGAVPVIWNPREWLRSNRGL